MRTGARHRSGAALDYATGNNRELDFANNVLAPRAKLNADVIVDHVTYFDEPVHSDGLPPQTIDLVSEQGSLRGYLPRRLLCESQSAPDADLDSMQRIAPWLPKSHEPQHIKIE